MDAVRELLLPDLGEGLEDGEVVEWHVEVDDEVSLNQPVVDIETAKAIVSVPSPFAGRVVERHGEVGELLAVGTVLLRIATTEAAAQTSGAGSAPDARREDATASSAGAGEPGGSGEAGGQPRTLVGYGERDGAEVRGAAASGSGASARTGAVDGGRAPVLAKPSVRRLARELGVDLAALSPGSGPDGIVTREDVEAAAGTGSGHGTAAPVDVGGSGPVTGRAPVAGRRFRVPAGFRGRSPGEVLPVTGVRRRVADRMARSRSEIPEAMASRDADLTELWRLCPILTDQAAAEGHEVRITPLAVVLRVVALGLRRFPTLNARFDTGEGESRSIRLLEEVNLGVAVDTERGLVVPNVRDALTHTIPELAAAVADLARRARSGRLRPEEVTGGTFTVNNYGVFGSDDGDPIINHPECGILGMGAIRERPWVVDGRIEPRRVARFTLAFDHRVCDGGEAARFVTWVAQRCEQPGSLLLYQDV